MMSLMVSLVASQVVIGYLLVLYERIASLVDPHGGWVVLCVW